MTNCAEPDFKLLMLIQEMFAVSFLDSARNDGEKKISSKTKNYSKNSLANRVRDDREKKRAIKLKFIQQNLSSQAPVLSEVQGEPRLA